MGKMGSRVYGCKLHDESQSMSSTLAVTSACKPLLQSPSTTLFLLSLIALQLLLCLMDDSAMQASRERASAG